MSLLIKPPPPNVPFGWLANGAPVRIDQAWDLFLRALVARVGGLEAPTNNELAARAFPVSLLDDVGAEEFMPVPGPAGPRGPAGSSGILLLEEHIEDHDPRPPGVQPISGIYTPTLTNVANLDASTAYSVQYLQHGGVVIVSGKIDVNPTAAGLVQLGISLPIPSAFTAIHECSGCAASPGVAGQSAAIVADFANGRAEMEFTAVDLNNRAMYFTMMYRIL